MELKKRYYTTRFGEEKRLANSCYTYYNYFELKLIIFNYTIFEKFN